MQLGSLQPEDFALLQQSQCVTAELIDDVADFGVLLNALLDCGFDEHEIRELLAIVAGLLHLGNVDFADGHDGYAAVAKDSAASMASAAQLLGTQFEEPIITRVSQIRPHSPKGLTLITPIPELLALTQPFLATRVAIPVHMPMPSAMLTPTHTHAYTCQVVTINKDNSFTKKLNAKGAKEARDAMGRTVFVRLFDWLVSRVNAFAGGQAETMDTRCIGLLDIFGFERFDSNGFEQLCINYTNEKLQQFFLQQVFKAEEEIHRREGVHWRPIEFQDNQGCIDLIEKNPHGILRILDTQCKMPGGSDATFCEAVNSAHKASDFTTSVQRAKRRTDEAFVVNHFAGKVCYDRKQGSWLEKNNDFLPGALAIQLEASSLALVRSIFGVNEGASVVGGVTDTRAAKRSATFNSIGRRFMGDMSTLLVELSAASSHFVRCIKPNASLSPAAFEPRMVLEQLRCGGVFDAVEVIQSSYSTRIPYEAVFSRYAALLPADLVGDLPPSAFCEVVALACNVAYHDYALGFTLLFVKAGKGVFLEELLDMDMELVIPLLTEKIRDWKRRKAAAVVIARRVRGWWEQSCFTRLRLAAGTCQRAWRGARSRKELRRRRRERDAKTKQAAAAAAREQDAEVVAAAERVRVGVTELREQAQRLAQHTAVCTACSLLLAVRYPLQKGVPCCCECSPLLLTAGNAYQAQRLAQQTALQHAHKATAAEEARRQAAEASLDALQERLALQTEQIVALQACVCPSG